MSESRAMVCEYLPDDRATWQDVFQLVKSAHGEETRVFARSSAKTGGTLVAILPKNGPSLARALWAWVQEWWSDVDDESYGSPYAYLKSYGVTIPTDDMAAYATSCPFCGTADGLSVVSGYFATTGVPLSHDGFALDDAKQVDTEDVIVQCGHCQKHFPLALVIL